MQQLNTSEHIYFRGLNGLRFFAALAVIVTHIELVKEQMGFEGLWKTNLLVFELGSLGVIFFFVLSGFLITYLLLKEKAATGTIAVRKFYLRRILRIWPLYYLVVLLGFFVLPHLHFMEIPFLSAHFAEHPATNLLLYLFMLPNLAFAMYAAVPHIGQTWSIGVEEQFYILWPLIVKFSRSVLRALLLVIVVLIAAKAIVLLAYNSHPDNAVLKVLKPFLAMTKMESMAIGGLGAYYLFHGEKIKVLYSNVLLVLALAAIPLMVYLTPAAVQDGAYLVYSVLFLVIIVNVSCNPGCFIRLETPLFVMLGNISYGIYMYHLMVIALVVGGLKFAGFRVDNSIASQLLVYASTIFLTVLVSWLSYRYFESFFLKLKKKFTVVKSGLA